MNFWLLVRMRGFFFKEEYKIYYIYNIIIKILKILKLKKNYIFKYIIYIYIII